MLDPRIVTRNDIALIDASHVVVREGRQPCRIVMYKERNGTKGREQWIVHKECLTTGVAQGGTSCAFSHAGFSDGDYCGTEDRAREKFDERVKAL